MRVKSGGKTWAPNTEQNSFHTRNENCGPLSHTMSLGCHVGGTRGWSTASHSPRQWATFEKQSTVVRMTELPEDGGSPVIKSSAMCDQGFQGTCSGLRRPAGGELDTFFCAQLGQADTNSWTSRARDGHQKKCCISGQVRFLPR